MKTDRGARLEHRAEEQGGFAAWLRSVSDAAWRLLVVAAAVGLVLWVTARLRLVIVPVLLGAFIASLWSPMVGRLRRRGVPRLAATWVAVILGVGSLTGVGWAVGAAIASQSDELAASVQSGWEEIVAWFEDGPLGLDPAFIQDATDAIADQVRENADRFISGAIGGASVITELVTGILFTAVSAFFVLKDGDRAWHWLLSRVPADRRSTVDEAGLAAWSTLRRYLGGTFVVGTVDGVFIGLGLAILGVPLYVPLAVLVVFGSFFPVIGSFIAGLVAVLVTLAANGLGDALIVVVIVVAIQEIEGDVLAPVVLGRSVALHPFIVIVALAVGVVVAGIVGAFLAVPLAAIGGQIIRHVFPAVVVIDPSVVHPSPPDTSEEKDERVATHS